jgi:hypothetical protein
MSVTANNKSAFDAQIVNIVAISIVKNLANISDFTSLSFWLVNICW